jgi:hypothetical protein
MHDSGGIERCTEVSGSDATLGQSDMDSAQIWTIALLHGAGEVSRTRMLLLAVVFVYLVAVAFLAPLEQLVFFLLCR